MFRSGATPTSSTPGSPPASGPSAPSAGPKNTEELQKYFPTSVLITGFDIIFFWVARMMMMQLAVVEQVPFHTVYVHALVRDEKGKKMSKSLGNVLDPLELIDEYGADAVRFTLTAMAAMGRDLKLSTARIAGYRNFGTKLWNATRFAEMNGVFEGYAPDGGIPQPKATREPLDHRRNRPGARGGRRGADQLTASTTRPTRFTPSSGARSATGMSNSPSRCSTPRKPPAETRATMAWVLDQCLILLHPIMPFITEELWATDRQAAKRCWSMPTGPTYGAELIDPAADREMNWVIALIEEIRSARAQMHVPVGLQPRHAATGAGRRRPRRLDAQRGADQPAGPDREPDRGGRAPRRARSRSRSRAAPSRSRWQASSTSPRRRRGWQRRWRSWRRTSAACAGG